MCQKTLRLRKRKNFRPSSRRLKRFSFFPVKARLEVILSEAIGFFAEHGFEENARIGFSNWNISSLNLPLFSESRKTLLIGCTSGSTCPVE